MNIYFDMDGVLVQYDRNAYASKEAPFYQKGAHYFRELPPDNTMLSVFHVLKHQRLHNLYIVTSIINDSKLCIEHCNDKLYWLNTHGVYPDTKKNLLFAASSKQNCVEEIQKRKLTKKDVLIDDYNPNLLSWKTAGGTAIKYINGLNNPNSYHGPKITNQDSVMDILQYINTLERN